MGKSENRSVRVRFAPSPTGYLHIGSLRAALFNWLYAKSVGGKFLIRIEDTDRARSTKEFEQSILDSLDWVGIKSDEPILYQNDQLSHHKKIVKQLLAEGKAYKCFCSQEELAEKKERTIQQGKTYQYDQTCRDLSQDENDDRPFVVRLKIDSEEQFLVFDDLVKGEIKIPSEQIDDFILLRSDGTVTYNLAVVQDDHDMKISHVIRGEDHIVNTAKQILIYKALGYVIPEFAHIPLILGDKGQKLSKRDAVTSVIEYKKDGYLPEALCNYLARLGWSHGDQEIFTMSEMEQLFSLKAVQKSGAKFDIEKLKWVNAQFVKKMSAEQLLKQINLSLNIDFAEKTVDWSDQLRLSAINLYKDRVTTLKELSDNLLVFYSMPTSYDKLNLKKIIEKDSRVILQLLQQEFEKISFEKQEIFNFTKAFCKSHDYKVSQIAQLLRFTLIGKASGPSVFEMMALLGKKEVQRRMSNGISLL